jgi:hypothetical protein
LRELRDDQRHDAFLPEFFQARRLVCRRHDA